VYSDRPVVESTAVLAEQYRARTIAFNCQRNNRHKWPKQNDKYKREDFVLYPLGRPPPTGKRCRVDLAHVRTSEKQRSDPERVTNVARRDMYTNLIFLNDMEYFSHLLLSAARQGNNNVLHKPFSDVPTQMVEVTKNWVTAHVPTYGLCSLVEDADDMKSSPLLLLK
jgi:hypothetical protein